MMRILHLLILQTILQLSHGFGQIILNYIRNEVMMSVSYPFSIKNVVSKMTESTQSALQQKTTRMEIELPPACDFGIEISGKGSSPVAAISNADKIKRSNREITRMYGDMFSSFSSKIVALFPSEDEANSARRAWGVLFRGQVLSIEAPDAKGYGKLRSRRFSALEQEQALMASDGYYIPEGTEVLIIAGPRPKDLKKILKIHEKLGEDTLIILVNARLSAQELLKSNVKEEVEKLRSIFTPVFHYAPPVIDSSVVDITNRELLVYYEYVSKIWSLAEKDKENRGILGIKLGSSVFTVRHCGREIICQRLTLSRLVYSSYIIQYNEIIATISAMKYYFF